MLTPRQLWWKLRNTVRSYLTMWRWPRDLNKAARATLEEELLDRGHKLFDGEAWICPPVRCRCCPALQTSCGDYWRDRAKGIVRRYAVKNKLIRWKQAELEEPCRKT